MDESKKVKKDESEDNETFEPRDETNVPLGEKLKRMFEKLDAKFRKFA